MTKRLFIHIGMPKTGTTSLQSFTYDNRAALAERGLHHPSTLGKQAQWRIPVYMNDLKPFAGEGSTPTIHSLFGITTEKHLEDFRADTEIRLAQEVRNLEGGLDRTLFSAAWFYTSKFNEIERLHGLLNPHFDEIKIICYLRRQDEFLISSYSTALRRGIRRGLNGWFTTDRREHLDYDVMLTRWSDVFGAKAVVPRLYDKREWVKQDLVADYMSALGVEDTDSLPRPQRLNESMNTTGQAILRMVNRAYPLRQNRQDNRGHTLLLGVLSDAFPGAGQLPRPARRQELLDHFVESNENVRRKWFPERTNLFPPLSDKDEGERVKAAEVATDDWIALMGPLLDKIGQTLTTADRDLKEERAKTRELSKTVRNATKASGRLKPTAKGTTKATGKAKMAANNKATAPASRESRLRRRVRKKPDDLDARIRLCTLLLAENRAADAAKAFPEDMEVYAAATPEQLEAIEALSQAIETHNEETSWI
ncbi:MAG: hypothetical protein Kilf2KO_22720 [Rhodospirillales bacterium]